MHNYSAFIFTMYNIAIYKEHRCYFTETDNEDIKIEKLPVLYLMCTTKTYHESNQSSSNLCHNSNIIKQKIFLYTRQHLYALKKAARHYNSVLH